jgi:hypothetical protein
MKSSKNRSFREMCGESPFGKGDEGGFSDREVFENIGTVVEKIWKYL